MKRTLKNVQQSKKNLPLVLAALLFGACGIGSTGLAHAGPAEIASATLTGNKIWITVGEKAYAELQILAPKPIVTESQLTQSALPSTLRSTPSIMLR